MLVDSSGEVLGSVSGGCVEAAVYDLATTVASTGTPELVRYGVSDDDAFQVGLTCGGVLDVWVERVSRTSFPELGSVIEDIRHDRPVAVATLIEHDDPSRVGRRFVVRPDTSGQDVGRGSLGSAELDSLVHDRALEMLESGTSGLVGDGLIGDSSTRSVAVFVSTFPTKPRMIVFGAIDFAAALVTLADFLGFRVTVCDARPVFATQSRFPDADEVIVQWPHLYLAIERDACRIDSRTVLAVLTHDPKFDVPLLEVALRLDHVAYVGAMGSRQTHEDRAARLVAAGVTDVELQRLASPIGLDLGARSPAETAISIAAEIIARRHGASGQRLCAMSGPIHTVERAAITRGA
ncbi:xanthine dehydrogenase accessory factor [Nocardioides cavernae]|nr:xanthine dehydrogenase accessory factor [Nocardioides cavernae]